MSEWLQPIRWGALVWLAIIALAVTGCAGQTTWRGKPVPTGAASPAPSPVVAASPSPAVTTPAPGGSTPAATPVPPPTPAAATPAAYPQTSDKLEAVLARGATDTYEPRDPASEFPEDAEKIHLVVKSLLPQSATVRATWIAVSAEGYEANQKVREDTVSLGAGARGALWVGAPAGGFLPGDYRVDVAVDGEQALSLPFKVIPLLPPAALAEPQEIPRGFNIALAVLGGRVERSTSEYNDNTWAARNLIDGVHYIWEGQACRPTCGWSSQDNSVPQEIVFSFSQRKEALISAIVIDTSTTDNRGHPARIAKHVEIWSSTSSPNDGFTKVAGARLHARPAEQLITLPPTRARFVMLRILSNNGGNHTELAEVKIIEARDGGPSILTDPLNLAFPALGGAIVRFTSKSPSGLIGHLIDAGEPSNGWWSGDGPSGPASYLPQEIVFAFRGDQIALLDRIVLNPKSAHDPSTWPRVVTISVSTESPFDGFQEVGQFTLTQAPGDQAFPIGQRARFVKLRILKDFGGRFTSLGKVKILEGSAPGYESILLTSDTGTPTGAAATPQADESGIAIEHESNNAISEANALELGRRTRGAIDPLGEHDYFKLSFPGTSPSVLTLELLGRPNIRTSLTLLDPGGKALKRFDPGRIPSERAQFSWQVNAGDHFVQVTEPPISMVMIWDTSGSMGQNDVENLRQAMEAYLDQVRPSERLNLIRFSGTPPEGGAVEVLLPEFSSDPARLRAAVQAKFFAKGGTPFYDAVAKGIELLEGVQGNRAIVVMTDGADTTSRLSHPGFWRLLEEKRIRLYTIGLGFELKTYEPRIGTNGSGVLSHAAMATNGRFFFARTAEELKGFYQQIAAELRTISTYYLRATVSQGPGSLAVAATGERLEAVSAPSQIELILDVSGSMKLKIEGRQKMDIAKDVMSQIIKGLPDNARVALRFYGHRIREGRPGDCQDTELVFPFGKIDKAAMLARVRAVKALGTTPIAYTLRQVPGDFGTAPGEKLVILVTDGKEECGGSPSAVVSEILAKGIKIRLNIVGFALAEVAVREEMERVAKLTGGKFFDAQNAKALREAIQRSLAVPYDVTDAAGTRVAAGLTGEGPIKVPEGIYIVTVRAAGQPIVVPNVRVRHNAFTKVALRKEGQEIGVQVLGP